MGIKQANVLPKLNAARAHHNRCVEHAQWACAKYETEKERGRTWEAIFAAEREMNRAMEILRIASRDLKLAEFYVATYRPVRDR